MLQLLEYVVTTFKVALNPSAAYKMTAVLEGIKTTITYEKPDTEGKPLLSYLIERRLTVDKVRDCMLSAQLNYVLADVSLAWPCGTS